MSLEDRVKEAREAFESIEPPARLETRLRRSLREPAATTYGGTWWGSLSVAAAALILGVALGWWLKAPTEVETQRVVVAPADSKEDDANDGPEIVATDPGCAVAADADGRMVVPARCRVELERFGVVIDAWEQTELRTTALGVAMPSGLAAFAVDPVPAGQPPFEVDVGAARIRVIGTRFVVANETSGGQLDLIEGVVELVHGDEVESVAAGQRVSWSETEAETETETETESENETEAETAGGRVRAEVDLSETLRGVARLRRQGDYAAALKQLDGLRAATLDAGTWAVVSYERGTLLEAAGRTDAACEHWRKHLRRHAGRGPGDVADRRARLGCDD